MRNNNIKLLIVERGLRQNWVAKQVGVTTTTLSQWATNRTQPNAESLIKLMSVLECSPEDIYGKI